LCELPSVQRQLQHLLIGHHLADAWIARFDKRRRPFDRNRLSQLSDLQRHVKRRVRIDLQDDPRLRVRSEAL
jgi:hypothetical protein